MKAFVERLTLGPLQTNSYLAGAHDADALVVIDPAFDADRLIERIEASGRRLEAVLLTHGHFDHVGALAQLQERFAVTAYAHEDALPQLASAAESAAFWGIAMQQPEPPAGRLAPGQELTFAGLRMIALHTPGHAPGHISFHLPDEGIVFSGDALFRGSVGRVDLPMGDGAVLLRSIRAELLTLPDDTVVLSGHGDRTTIGSERATNPFLH